MSKLPKAARRYLARIGRKGGKARLTTLTPERRREIARNAIRARWARRDKRRYPDR